MILKMGAFSGVLALPFYTFLVSCLGQRIRNNSSDVVSCSVIGNSSRFFLLGRI